MREDTETQSETPTLTYRERREAKAARLRGWADKREEKAEVAYSSYESMASVIPCGQPILSGHYSERSDRSYRGRVNSQMGKYVEHTKTAERMRSRADHIEQAAAGAIYSDDPDAVEALNAKIERLTAERKRITDYNKTCRKGAPDLSLLDEKQRHQIQNISPRTAFQYKDGAFPSYHLSNLSGTIRSARVRLESLTAAR